MVERNGKLIAKQVKNTNSETLTNEAIKSIKESELVYTDEWLGYKDISRIYDHQIVKYNNKEYVKGRIHTNTIRGFWSLLKRGIIGIYHFTSKKHLQKYVDEFVFRYYSKDSQVSNTFNLMLSNTEYRLIYKSLING